MLDLIAEGLTNRQIGERLFLAEKTVKNYVTNVLAKLGMQRRTQAACSCRSCCSLPDPHSSPGPCGLAPRHQAVEARATAGLP